MPNNGSPAVPRRTNDLVATAVREINRIYVTKTLETYLAIGRYVLETFFEGDFEVFRSRRRSDENFKALAQREDLMVSATTLWRSVAVLQQSRGLPGEVARGLSISHHLELLKVKDEERKAGLARAAVEEGMSRGELAEEIRGERGGGEEEEDEAGEPVNRSPLVVKELVRTRTAVDRLALAARGEAFGGSRGAERPSGCAEPPAARLERRRLTRSLPPAARLERGNEDTGRVLPTGATTTQRRRPERHSPSEARRSGLRNVAATVRMSAYGSDRSEPGAVRRRRWGGRGRLTGCPALG